jgi:hypothetical protein
MCIRKKGHKLAADGRTRLARRYSVVMGDLVASLGGLEHATEPQISLCRRAASLQCACEADEARMAAGEAVNLELYTRATGLLRRILVSLGVQPVDKMRRTHVTIAAHQRRARIPAPERSDQLHVRQTAVDRLRERGEQAAAREQAKQAETA